jgi:hypothetical protein
MPIRYVYEYIKIIFQGPYVWQNYFINKKSMINRFLISPRYK